MTDNQEPLIGDAPPKADVVLSNGAYDWFKRTSLYILPALASAYFGLAQIWGLPKAEEVVGTVAVLETLLGVILRLSGVQYDNSEAKYDGVIQVVDRPHETEEEVVTTDLNVSLDSLAVSEKDSILVKVERA